MPEKRGRIHATHTFRFSKTVEAPLKYVYDWCTDFRDDDGQFSSSKPQFKVLRFGRDRVVRIRLSTVREKNAPMAVELVRLYPPDSWHVDQIDESDLDSVDYKVSRIGPRRSRVTLEITERWMTPRHPSLAAWSRSTNRYWDTLVTSLEASYHEGRPAKGD